MCCACGGGSTAADGSAGGDGSGEGGADGSTDDGEINWDEVCVEECQCDMDDENCWNECGTCWDNEMATI